MRVSKKVLYEIPYTVTGSIKHTGLSYLGIPAVVVHGDSLAMEEYARFYTPVYMMGGWIWREPMTLANGFCVDDENLKCMLEPMYGLLKYGINTKKEKTEDGQVSGNA